jgi:hypothetical protein
MIEMMKTLSRQLSAWKLETTAASRHATVAFRPPRHSSSMLEKQRFYAELCDGLVTQSKQLILELIPS